MSAMRRAALAAAAAMAAAVGVPHSALAAAPEADVAHHGYAALSSGGRLDVLVLSRNLGPSDLEDATLRVTVSVPLAEVGRTLPAGCLRGGDRVVLCSTGALPADGTAQEVALRLQVEGTPFEVTVRVDTVWCGGATDRYPDDNDQRVLVPATGDPYAF
ncbi:hypothetical protein [Streptomyces sp. CC228A]|uniref:hypothetical protein n=1 Tax=Streptomyces sp. CC228A TaxID=2898186 RepID=UPI001F19AF04|nr:hypothetical protein [Streptomyces sp. CC228A]